MTNAAAQATAFFRKVARDGCVWTLRDRGGYPAPVAPDGKRVQPFWSSRFRALRMSRTVEGFAGYDAVQISWPDFRDRWLPGLERDGLLVGINWSGSKAIGYDVEPAMVKSRVERAIHAYERSMEPRTELPATTGARGGVDRRLPEANVEERRSARAGR